MRSVDPARSLPLDFGCPIQKSSAGPDQGRPLKIRDD